MRSYQTLLCDSPEPHILVVTFNRPAASNALNTQLGRDVLDVFRDLLFDAGDIRCVILTGAGDKAFCAGGDLKERNGMTDQQWRSQHVIFEQCFYAIMDCPVPVIAAVNGAAYGGGCEFALACDFVYAADTARFALVETSLGIIPGGGGTQNLQRAVGVRRARELILTAGVFTAAEAEKWGLVNRVTEANGLLAAAMEAARRIAGNAPIAVRQAKRAINAGGEVDLKTGLVIEIEAYNRAAATRDRVEGIAARNEKRLPVWRGE